MMKIQVNQTMQAALAKMTEDGFGQTAGLLNDTRNAVREEIKRLTAAKMNAVIAKLSGTGTLSPDEIALIELWVVGDAESSAALEDDFNDLIGEYTRLAASLSAYENKECSVDDLFKLLGLLEDASHASFDVASSLEKKERIAKFKAAVAGGFDGDERGYLTDFLRGKLNSEEY